MDPTGFTWTDTNGDGVGDFGTADLDGDGFVDATAIDLDYDGHAEGLQLDPTGDGYLEVTLRDSDRDGSYDTQGVDVDADGVMDHLASPSTGGVPVVLGDLPSTSVRTGGGTTIVGALTDPGPQATLIGLMETADPGTQAQLAEIITTMNDTSSIWTTPDRDDW